MSGQQPVIGEETMAPRQKCPDCISCQGCAKTRCRQCRRGRNAQTGSLGPFLTHGEYMAWKAKIRLEGAFSPCGSCAERDDGAGTNKIPSLDVGECSGCESCMAVCPQVFRRNPQTGLIEVVEVEDYSEEEVREAIKLCPAGCITLE